MHCLAILTQENYCMKTYTVATWWNSLVMSNILYNLALLSVTKISQTEALHEFSLEGCFRYQCISSAH